MGGVTAAAIVDVPLFWVAMVVLAVAMATIAVPASSAGKVDRLGVDSLTALQRRWPVSARRVIGIPAAFTALGLLLFGLAGAQTNERTIERIEAHYGARLDLGSLDLPVEGESVPVQVDHDGTRLTAELTKLNGAFHVLLTQANGTKAELRD